MKPESVWRIASRWQSECNAPGYGLAVEQRERWIAAHQALGHDPHPAPTKENPEQWECKCDPDAAWTAIWRIHTREQVRQKFAHLAKTRR